jgi:hypothetical protein
MNEKVSSSDQQYSRQLYCENIWVWPKVGRRFKRVHPENAQLHNVQSSYKTSRYQTPSCKTSRIQNVQDTNVQDTNVQDTNVQDTNFQNTKRLIFVNFKTCFKKPFCIFLPWNDNISSPYLKFGFFLTWSNLSILTIPGRFVNWTFSNLDVLLNGRLVTWKFCNLDIL